MKEKESPVKKHKKVPASILEDKVGYVKVINIEQQDDGGCTMDFEVDDKFIEFYKQETGKKKHTKQGLGSFLEKLLIDAINENNDFALSVLAKN